MEITQIIIISLLIEAIWENLKMIWQNGKISVDKIGALIMSIIVCVLVNADIFNLIGLTISVPYIGSVLTGIITSRGSNFIHDLINKINEQTINRSTLN